MPEFNYIARNQDGVRIEDSITADNLKEASNKLLSDNLSIVKISERDTSFDFMTPFMERFNISMEKLKTRIPLTNLVFFTIEYVITFFPL